MEDYASKIRQYIEECHWLDLNDFLQEQELEVLVVADTSFQKFIYDTIKELIESIGYSDSRFIQFEFGLPQPSNFCTENDAKDCFKSLLNLLIQSGNNEGLNKLFLLA